MKTHLVILIGCIALTGCASTEQREKYRAQVDFRNEVGPVKAVPANLQHPIAITEEISFTVDTSPLDKNVRYSVAAGSYVLFCQSEEGDFYKGDGTPLTRKNSLGERKYEGGFFVPRDRNRRIMIWSYLGEGVLGVVTPSGPVVISSKGDLATPYWVIAIPEGTDNTIWRAAKKAD